MWRVSQTRIIVRLFFFSVSLSAMQLQQQLDEMTATWYIFCQCLGVPKHKLDEFESDIVGVGRSAKCMNAALEWWLKNYENATYEAIIEALESNLVGNRRLAKTFRELRDRGISTCMLNSFECWIWQLNLGNKCYNIMCPKNLRQIDPMCSFYSIQEVKFRSQICWHMCKGWLFILLASTIQSPAPVESSPPVLQPAACHTSHSPLCEPSYPKHTPWVE